MIFNIGFDIMIVISDSNKLGQFFMLKPKNDYENKYTNQCIFGKGINQEMNEILTKKLQLTVKQFFP